jgi:hypothetical protein
MTVLKIREPGGASHTFEPRPRPATCVVAVAVNPWGTALRSLGFLQSEGLLAGQRDAWAGSHFSSSVLVLVTTSP